MKDRTKVTNRAARRDYFILEAFEAGLELRGAEVKSLRAGKASLAESFAKVEDREIFLYHMYVNPYEYTKQEEQDSLRPKKLLLHRREIDYLIAQISQKRLSLIPLKIYYIFRCDQLLKSFHSFLYYFPIQRHYCQQASQQPSSDQTEI